MKSIYLSLKDLFSASPTRGIRLKWLLISLLFLNLTVNAGTATHLVYTTVPSTGTAGTAFSVTVQSQDVNGTPASPSSNTTITLTKASGGGALSGTLTGTISMSGNSVTISTPVYSKADVMTLTATATAGMTGLGSVTSGSITFTAGTATKLVYTSVPSTGTAGTAFSATVQTQDANGNPSSPTSNTTITLNKATGGGTLSGTLTGSIATSANSVTISTAVYSKADAMTLTATATAGMTVLTAITSGSITFTAGTATQLVFTTAAVSITAGAASGSITVQRQDAYGNANTTDATITATLGSTSTGIVTFNPASLTIANGSGSATFTYTDRQAGTPTITAQSASLTNGTQVETINAGAVTKLQILLPGETAAPGTSTGYAGTPTVETSGIPFTVTVNAVDAYWNVVSSTHSVAITSTDAGATLPTNAALVAGTKTFSVTLNTAGSWTVTATDTHSSPLTANTSASVTVMGIVYTSLLNTFSNTAPTLPGVIVTPPAGYSVSGAPALYYKLSTDANTVNDNTSGTPGWKYVTATGSGPYSFTLNYGLLYSSPTIASGTVIQYFVTAQDNNSDVAINSGTFNTWPASTSLTSAAFPLTGTINSYSVLNSSGTVTVGTGGTYTSLTNAGGLFQALNASTLTGPVTVKISSSLTPHTEGSTGETGTYTLDTISGSSINNTITISPVSATLDTISGTGVASATAMIVLAGAGNVIIDGQYSGDGLQHLLFRNTNSTAANTGPVIEFNATVTGDTLRNCFVESNATNAAYGAVTIGATGANVIEVANCNIHDATSGSGSTAGTVASAIYSNNGSNTLTIQNNNIYNFASYGLNLAGIANGAKIQGNSFYYLIGTSTVSQAAIYITGSSYGHTISNNSIGGQSSNTGVYNSPWLNSFAGASYGMYLTLGNTTATRIFGNAIRNFTLSGSGSSFYGIYSTAGLFDIGGGGLGGNTIGDTATVNPRQIQDTYAGTSSLYPIYITSSVAGDSISNNYIENVNATETVGAYLNTFYGIYANLGTPTTTSYITNDTIRQITLNGTGASVFYGINVPSTVQVVTISGNMIGSLSSSTGIKTRGSGVTDGISLTSAATSTSLYNSIYGNTIAGMADSISAFTGIAYAGSTTYNVASEIVNNTIQSVTDNGAGGAFIGINVTSGRVNVGVSSNGLTAEGNTIGDPTGTYPITFGTLASSNAITGISYVSASTTADTIANNTIAGINSSVSGSSNTFYGISLGAVAKAPVIQSNIVKSITLSGTGAGAFYGIYGALAMQGATIGGSSAAANYIGTATAGNISNSGTGATAGIYIVPASAAAYTYNISNNSIKGITAATTGTTATGVNGIYVSNSSATLANINNNNISIIKASGTAASFNGIYASLSSGNTIQGDTVMGITMTGTTGATFNGIQLAGATAATVGASGTGNANLIGYNLTGDSILYAGSAAAYGINSGSSGALSISYNNVSYIWASNAATTTILDGIISTGGGVVNITNNTADNLTNATAINSIIGIPASTINLIGIYMNGAAAGSTISNDSIYTLKVTSTAAVLNHVAGISVNTFFGASGSNTYISQNKIYDLENASTYASAITAPLASAAAIGIYVYSPTNTAHQYIEVSNNMVDLGYNQTANISFGGIMFNFPPGGAATTYYANVYYNSVNIQGNQSAAATNEANTFCLYRINSSATNYSTFTVANNIFNNARTNTSGTEVQYAIVNNGSTNAIANAGWGASSAGSNYNDLHTSGSTAFYWAGNQTLATWLTNNTNEDANSQNALPLFNESNGNGNLDLQSSGNCALRGEATPITTAAGYSDNISVDYHNNNRDVDYPTIGADELAASSANAISGTYHIGTGQTNAWQKSITAAIAYIWCTGVNGPVVLVLDSSGASTNYTQATETFPIIIEAITGASATNTITIQPNTTTHSSPVIRNSAAGSLFQFSGSSYVIFNGYNGTGNNALTIENTNTSNTSPVILFQNDASNDTIKNLNIKGGNSGSASGVVVFGNGATNGNANITFLNDSICPITGGETVVNAIYSDNEASGLNDTNTVQNCYIYNWIGSGVEVTVNGNGNSWTISGNDFYCSSTDGSSQQIAININTGFAYGSHSITNNIIGGSALNGGGSAWKNSTSTVFTGISIATNSDSSSLASEIWGNTITNITLSGSGANAGFSGIYVGAGLVNIGYTRAGVSATGNTIGGPYAISATGSPSGEQGQFAGIYVASDSSNTNSYIGNNWISNFSIGANSECSLNGIDATETGTATTYIVNNTFDSLTVNNNTPYNTCKMIVTRSGSTNVFNITGNTAGSTSTSAANIQTAGGNSANPSGAYFIALNTTASGSVISGNTVSGFYSTGYAQFKGIYINSAGSGTPTSIQNNLVNNITVAGGTSNGSYLTGIEIDEGTVNCGTTMGNIISSLYYSGTNQVYGIYNTSTAAVNIGAAGSPAIGNTITGIQNVNSGAQVIGIYSNANFATTIAGNTVSDIVSNCSNTTGGTNSSIIGIALTSTATTGLSVAQNTVDSIYNTVSSGSPAVVVMGIYYSGATSGSQLVSQNFVGSLSTSSSSGILQGIRIAAGTNASIQNNMVQLGIHGDGSSIAASAAIYGIYKDNAASSSFYYNSVYIGATGVTGSTNTAAFYRTATPSANDTIENNIFDNARSGGGPNYAYILNAPSKVISDYNIYYAPGTGGAIASTNGNGSTTLNLQTLRYNLFNASLPSYDLHSCAGDPDFVNPTGTSSTVSLLVQSPTAAWHSGTPITSPSITIDFGGNTRNSSTPDIGADESGTYTLTDVFTPVITGVSASPSTGLLICGGVASTTVTATIKDVGAGVDQTTGSGATGPELWYRSNSSASNAWTSVQYSSVAGNVYTWNLSIPAAASTTYQYYIAAQDLAPTPNVWYSQFNATQPSQANVNTQTGSSYTLATFNGETFATGSSSSSVSVTDVDNCGSSTLSTAATGSLLWSTGSTTTAITVTAAGSYSVTQTSSGCTVAGTAAPLFVPSAPTVSVSNNCGNSVLSTTATGTLHWSTGASTSAITVTNAATYSVTAKVGTCTSTSGTNTSAPLTVPSAPTVIVTNNCLSSTLSTTATGILLWNTGATTSAITVTVAGTYSVTQNNGTCTSIAGTKTAAPLTICDLSYPSPDTYTAGTAITNLDPTITGTPVSYSVNPSLPLGLSLNTSSGVISGTPTTTTATATYTVTATNASSSTTTFGIVITVNPGALSSFAIAQSGGGNISTQTAGTAFNISITAQDAYGNTVTSFTSTVALSTNAAYGSISPTTSSSFVNGVLSSQSVTVTQATSQAISASNGSSGISNTFSVNAGVFAKLQLLVPGQTAAPGSSTGVTGTPSTETAGSSFGITVNAVDANWNVVTSAPANTIAITSSDGGATLPSNNTLSSGTQTFSITLNTTGTSTTTATDNSDGTKTAYTSPSITVIGGGFVKMQILVPGETAAPGTMTGKTGTPTAQTAGLSFTVTVNAVDANWNVVTTAPANTIAITSSDVNATLPSNNSLSSGSQTFSVTLNTGGSWTVTATNVSDGTKTANTSASIPVNAGTASMLQILLPGETAAPGTSTGKTGTPTAQKAGASFTITVNAVDANWNVASSTHTVGITSSDGAATLPSNNALSAGTQTFSVTLNTYGSFTITATDITTGLTANTSASVQDNPYTFLVANTSGGTIATQTAGAPFNIEIVAQNATGGTLTSFDGVTVTLSVNASSGSISPTTSSSFVNGVLSSQSVTLSQAATGQAITAMQGTSGTSNSFNVIPAAFVKLQILLPGETAAPGTSTGKTGSPTAITSGTPITAIVNGVDANWNVVSSANDSIAITTGDIYATLPANARLVSGTNTFSVTLFTSPSQVVIANDASNSGITNDTSAVITVNPATIITTSTGGNWNVGSTWVGGIVPVPTDNAIIDAGATATVTANATVNSVTFNHSGTGTGTLTVNSEITLTVTGGITAHNGITINTSAAIAGAGTINCASLAVGGITPTAGGLTSSLTSTIAHLSISGNLTINGYDNGSGAQNQPTFALQSGITTVGGSVSVSEAGTPGGSGGIVTFTMATGAQNATLNLMGGTPFSLANSYVITLNGASSTVNYSGTTAQTVLASGYHDLTLSGSGNKNMSTGIFVGDVLSITGAAQANIDYGLDINVIDRLWLGGVAQDTGTWGSTTANKTHINDSYFTQTTGYLTIASAGAASSFSGLTGSQSICYGTSTITLSGTLSGPSSLYPAIGETINVSVNGNTQSTTVSDATGDFTINYSSAAIPASVSAYTISYIYPGNDTLNPSANTATTLLVNAIPSTPSVSHTDNCGNSTLTASSYTGTPYWSSGGATTSSITVTTGGTYSVTQTISGCTSLSGTTTASPLVIPSAPSVSDIDNCTSSTLSTTASGTLLWNTGATTTSITVTTGSTYSVTQTAGNGCTSVAGTAVASPIGYPSAPSVSDVDDCGSSTLSTTATGTLLWSTGATTSAITTTASSSFSVTQTVNGCISTPGIISSSPIHIPFAPSVSDADGCGSSVLTAGSYTGTLLWSTGATTSSITVTTSGTYSVMQTVSGCTSAQNFETAAPLALPSPTYTSQGDSSDCTFINITYTTQSGQSDYIWTIPGTLNTDYSIISGGIDTGSSTVTLQWLTAGSKTVNINYTNSIGCTAASPTSSTPTIATNCFFNYTVKLYIQGYYIGINTMSPLLKLLNLSANATDVDSVTIQLLDTAAGHAVDYSYTGILQSNGNVVCTFAGGALGGAYYTVVNHRNSLATWSAIPVTMTSGGTYDFTTSAAQAFGNNEVMVDGGVYAIYSGDVNQHGSIDGSDKSSIQTNLPSFILGTYNINDINGDGAVDATDYRILENNLPLNITVQHP